MNYSALLIDFLFFYLLGLFSFPCSLLFLLLFLSSFSSSSSLISFPIFRLLPSFCFLSSLCSIRFSIMPALFSLRIPLFVLLFCFSFLSSQPHILFLLSYPFSLSSLSPSLASLLCFLHPIFYFIYSSFSLFAVSSYSFTPVSH